MGQFFRPSTLLAASNFATYLDDLEGQERAEIRTPTREREEARSPLMLAFDEEAASAVL